jgi:hypothetical protein
VIGQDAARDLAAARYRMLFLGKYYETVDGVRHPFPTLDGSSFRDVVASGDAWLVNCAPLAGLTVEARVSRDGRWVEINQVSYASQ